MGTEIGARDFGDPCRYNMLEVRFQILSSWHIFESLKWLTQVAMQVSMKTIAGTHSETGRSYMKWKHWPLNATA